MDAADCYEALLDMGVSAESLNLVSNINGFSVSTFEDVLFAMFGYRHFDQLDDDC